jgi:hypothetical protein
MQIGGSWKEDCMKFRRVGNIKAKAEPELIKIVKYCCALT